ncbi:tetratricopeptide repeat protein [Actinokineospora bangkokensis]|uniref:tetratricopeptide repeat protein n=1 Tax=Actinokineospora bangkokensis TaxID=1193682 RepID=UPI000A7ED319|nr:hypothetical protein [Actinokineospora bangkokensis]
MSGWQALFTKRADERFPAEITRVIAEPHRYGEPDAMPTLAMLLDAAVITSHRLDASTIHDLVALSFNTLLLAGVNEGFDGHRQFFDSALQLIDLLEHRGHATTMLLLSAARFEARIDNGGARRRQFIERALSAAKDPGERLTALLTVAKFHTDISEYRKALAVLSECRRLSDNPLTEAAVDIETTTGVCYYYTDVDLAHRHFSDAVAMGGPLAERGDPCQPMATALHYLGRIASDKGQHQAALDHYVAGNNLAEGQLSGKGYFHQRLAEVLLRCGQVDEAEHHLVQAEATFARVGQVSIPLAILNGTWARLFVRTERYDDAERVLLTGLSISRRHGGPRAELMLRAELLTLRIKQGRWRDVLLLALRCLDLFIRTELAGAEGNPVKQILAQLRWATTTIGSAFRRKPRREADSQVTCPCGADHQPLTRERRR